MAHSLALSDLPDALLSRILVALASPEPGEPSNDVHEALAGQLLGPACLVCQLRHIDVYGGVFEPPGLAAFPLLSSYTVDACKFAGTPKLRSACYQAGTLNLDGTFSYNRTARNPLLPPIMDALLPAGCSELGPPTRLELSCCELCSDAQACQQLASVHALHLCDCFTCGDAGDDSDSEDVWQEYDAEEAELGISFAALRSLLQQVQALTDLSIEECLGGDADALDAPALPAGLTLLCLRGNDLAEMPAGPYPEGLADLDLGGNELTRLPPQLTGCSALTRLALDANEDLVLTLLDVRCVLTHLPRLARLELGAASLLPPRVERALLEAQPDLELSFTWGDTSSEGTSTSDEEGTSSESSEEEGSEEGMPPAP